MRHVWTIARRELRAYFATPVAYVFIVIFVALSGAFTFYLGNFFEREQADLTPFFGFHPWLHLVLAPAVSMRLWAEERQSGSVELLMCLPVAAWQAVLGKFLAAWLFIATALALTFPVWITVNYLGNPDNGVILAAYFGSLLMAGAYLAIGACISAACRSQVVAFVTTVVVCFVFLLAGFPLVLDAFAGWAPQVLVDVIGSLGFLTHFNAISKGVVDARDVLYFLLVIASFLYANAIVLDLGRGNQGLAQSGNLRYGRLGLGALALLFMAAVGLVNLTFRGLRLDLTEAGLYTLSDGARRVLSEIPEPVRLYFFVSRSGLADSPGLRSWADRVEDMLVEFEAGAGGRLEVSVIDPAPFSEEEDRAAAFGLQGVRLQISDEPLYFGVAGSNAVGDEEFIPFMNPQREQFLEYDLAKLVYTLSRSGEPSVGLVSGLPLMGGFDPATTSMTEPWIITSQISELFDLRNLDGTGDLADEDVDVLMLVHPKGATPGQLYDLEQFLFRGGRALIFVDPLAEADPANPPGGAMAGMPADRSSNLATLLSRWGLEMPAGTVVADARYALRVSEAGGALARHPAYIGVDLQPDSPGEVVTAQLDVLNFAFSGALRPLEDAALDFSPLVLSSADAGFLDANMLAFTPGIDSLWSGFSPGGEPLVLAARLSGAVGSAFPDGRPAAPASDGGNGGAESGSLLAGAEAPDGSGGNQTPLPQHLAEGEVQVIVVADTDLLTDRMWAQAQSLFGQRLISAFASNGDFVVNALDQLAGSTDLMSLRGRASFSRPFARVDELRTRAEAQFRRTEDQLQQELANTESRLAELQESRDDVYALSLTPEQEAELEQFTAQRLRIRKELREVRRNLDASIQRLGAVLKVVNIGLAPFLIGLGGLAVALIRRRARRRGS